MKKSRYTEEQMIEIPDSRLAFRESHQGSQSSSNPWSSFRILGQNPPYRW
jgi:hypothetical protein